MDTKLKNNNKRGNLLTVIVLLISSVGMLLFYPAFSYYITDQDQKEMRKGHSCWHVRCRNYASINAQ